MKGHQDDEYNQKELPLAAKLNCEADELAGTIHNTQFNWNIKTPTPPNNPIQVHLGNQTITSHLKRTLRQLIKHQPLLDHISKRAKWHPSTTKLVDWESHKRAIGTSQLPSKFITKFIHQILPVGNRVHCYKPYYNPSCPSCNEEIEDQFHLLTCPNVERLKWVSQMKQELIQFCTNTQTSEEIQLLLIHGISEHLQDCQLEYPEQYPTSIQVLTGISY